MRFVWVHSTVHTLLAVHTSVLTVHTLVLINETQGGKSAHIIFGDADVEECAANVLTCFTTNSGQCCCAGTRVLVRALVVL